MAKVLSQLSSFLRIWPIPSHNLLEQLYTDHCVHCHWGLTNITFRSNNLLHEPITVPVLSKKRRLLLQNFLKAFFVPRVPYSVPGLYVMYNIWQDAGIRTRVAAILQPGVLTVQCATNDLHTEFCPSTWVNYLHMSTIYVWPRHSSPRPIFMPKGTPQMCKSSHFSRDTEPYKYVQAKSTSFYLTFSLT